MTYINTNTAQGTETVDQFDSFKEAKAMLEEYRMAFYGQRVWLSSRSTKIWREEA